MEQFAWAAGFFDGEGCVQLYKRIRHDDWVDWQLMVTAVNTDIRPLVRMKALFGGSIQPMQKAGNKHGYLPSWAWMPSHAKAAKSLEMMLPWLTVKREQAELALQSRKYIQPHKRQRSQENRDALDLIRVQLSTLKKQPVGLAGLSVPPTGREN